MNFNQIHHPPTAKCTPRLLLFLSYQFPLNVFKVLDITKRDLFKLAYFQCQLLQWWETPSSSGSWPLQLWHPTTSEEMFRGRMLGFVPVSNENGCWISLKPWLSLGVSTSHQAYRFVQKIREESRSNSAASSKACRNRKLWEVMPYSLQGTLWIFCENPLITNVADCWETADKWACFRCSLY